MITHNDNIPIYTIMSRYTKLLQEEFAVIVEEIIFIMIHDLIVVRNALN